MAVHIDHAAELVAQTQHHARVVGERGDGEHVLVQLDGVGGVGERAHGALRPARHVVVEPAGGHLVHLVVPGGAKRDRVLGGEGDDLEAQLGVVTRSGDGLLLGGRQHQVDVQEGGSHPRGRHTAQVDGVLVLGETQVGVRGGGGALRGLRVDGVHHRARTVLDREVLVARRVLVDATQVHHRRGTQVQQQGEGALVRAAVHRGSHGERRRGQGG